MLMIIFLLSYVGILSAIGTNRAALTSFGISEKKLRSWCQLFALLCCFFCFWFQISAFHAWFFFAVITTSAPLMTFATKKWRSDQIPERCLQEMDRMLLYLKTGHSLRQALNLSLPSETGWFRPFLVELQRSFELHITPATESLWFNSWAQEIMEIEKSRVKVIEQAEAVRRGLKVELELKRKIKRVSEGPRLQTFFMTFLFLALHVFAFQNLTLTQMKALFPAAWVLFIVGAALSWSMPRWFRWNI